MQILSVQRGATTQPRPEKYNVSDFIKKLLAAGILATIDETTSIKIRPEALSMLAITIGLPTRLMAGGKFALARIPKWPIMPYTCPKKTQEENQQLTV